MEAFVLLCYKNGYKRWIYELENNREDRENNGNNKTDTTDDRPPFEFTNVTKLTRNGGWSYKGMKFYEQTYNLVKKNREENPEYATQFYEWYKKRTGPRNQRKRDREMMKIQSMDIPDDLDDLSNKTTIAV